MNKVSEESPTLTVTSALTKMNLTLIGNKRASRFDLMEYIIFQYVL